MLTSRGVRMEESSVPVWASALGWQCQALRHGRHVLILGRKNLDRLGVETEDAPVLKIHSNLKWGAEPARNLPCQSPSRLPTTSLQHSARLPLRPSVVQNATNYNTALRLLLLLYLVSSPHQGVRKLAVTSGVTAPFKFEARCTRGWRLSEACPQGAGRGRACAETPLRRGSWDAAGLRGRGQRDWRGLLERHHRRRCAARLWLRGQGAVGKRQVFFACAISAPEAPCHRAHVLCRRAMLKQARECLLTA